MIKKFSFEIFKPDWPRWKINLADFFLNISPLGVAKANRMLKKHSAFKNDVFIKKATADLGHKFEFIGVDNLPETGAVTLVANHPGGADVVGTIVGISEKRKDLVVLANEMICVEPVMEIVLPVNTLNKKDKVDMGAVHQAYKDGKVVVFYAAGKNSRYNENEELRDRKWRTTFLDFALMYKTPVVIMNIGGANADIFYKVSKFRENNKRLKNIPLENFFQLKELVNPKKYTVKMMFSEPILSDYIEERLESKAIKDKRKLGDEMYNFLYEMSEDKLRFNK